MQNINSAKPMPMIYVLGSNQIKEINAGAMMGCSSLEKKIHIGTVLCNAPSQTEIKLVK